VSIPEGYFVDWNGNARSTSDPGGGCVCEVDAKARYVGVNLARDARDSRRALPRLDLQTHALGLLAQAL
jgi:hypothetical protein